MIGPYRWNFLSNWRSKVKCPLKPLFNNPFKSVVKWRAATRFASRILLIRAVNHFSYQSVLFRWLIMCQFELMDPTETQMGKADYIRVLTPQEPSKFVRILHPLPEVTKTLNNKEPWKIPKEDRMHFGVQHQHCSLNRTSRLHSITATLLQASSPLLASLIGNLLF